MKITKITRNFVFRFLNIENNKNYLNKLIKRGLVVGKEFNMQKDVILDDTHCWLIQIGNNVTLAPRVHILCHDASTKNDLNYTKIGTVIIGDNVFVGASAIIMPSVNIGNNVVVAAGSIVTKDIPSGNVVAGNPARIIDSYDSYMFKMKGIMSECHLYDETYTMRLDINDEKKNIMKSQILASKDKKAFII